MGLDMYMKCNDRELTQAVNENKFEARRGTIIYWRKANAINKWILENAECSYQDEGYRDVELTVNDLKNLRDVCREVLADHSKASKLLPTSNGFFFGSQDYDELYFDDVRYTEEKLTRILELIKHASKLEVEDGEYAGITWSDDYYYSNNDWIVSFEYHASW